VTRSRHVSQELGGSCKIFKKDTSATVQRGMSRAFILARPMLTKQLPLHSQSPLNAACHLQFRVTSTNTAVQHLDPSERSKSPNSNLVRPDNLARHNRRLQIRVVHHVIHDLLGLVTRQGLLDALHALKIQRHAVHVRRVVAKLGHFVAREAVGRPVLLRERHVRFEVVVGVEVASGFARVKDGYGGWHFGGEAIDGIEGLCVGLGA
jgi:hypothetical protein